MKPLPTLPDCRHRQPAGLGRVRCDSPRMVGHPADRPAYPASVCVDCSAADKPARAGQPAQAPRADGPCPHLGEPTGRTRDCTGCRGSVRLKVMACAIHGECTVGRKADGLACCDGCRDRPGAGPGVLVTGGIGDFLAVESMTPPEERGRIEAAYYACPAAETVRTLFAALPNYPRLKSHVVLPTGGETLYDRAGVEQAAGPIPPGVADWSISRVFKPGTRAVRYTGSSFLSHRLAAVELPPGPYAVVVAHSDWGKWPGRDFDRDDWRACLETLERHGLTGVVLAKQPQPVPTDGRLLDLQGRTSILESVEILKAARGYLGIDSALSVLAAKLFPVARLAVKSVNPQCRQFAGSYFAPHTAFPFLQDRLGVPPWE